VAAEFAGGGEDRGVPVRDLITTPERDGFDDQFPRDRLNRNMAREFEHRVDIGLGEAQ